MLGPLSERRAAAPHLPRRQGEGHRLPRGLRGRCARPARAARRDGRAPLAPRGEPSGPPRRRAIRRRGARRLLPLARRRRGAGRAQERPRGPPDAVRQLDARLRCCSVLARIYGNDELERRAVGVFRLVRGAVTRAPSAFGHALTALDLHFSPPRELAIVGPVESPVARAALEPFQPNTVVAVGPCRRDPAPCRQGPRRRQAGGLRLRALRVPGAGHGRGRALGGFGAIWTEPLGRAAPPRPGPVMAITGASCVRGRRTTIAPRRRAISRQTLQSYETFTAPLQKPHASAGDSPRWQPRLDGSSWPPWLRGSRPWPRWRRG